jgi:hypothetical protein
MPLYSIVKLELERPPHHDAALGNAIHGLVHHMLGNPDPDIATQVHEQQRKALTLRNFALQNNILHLEIAMLSDQFAPAIHNAFQAGMDFGRVQDTLKGRVKDSAHHPFTLESIQQRIQSLPAPQFVRLEFLSPTAFTHKKGTWASPHPSLLFDSLLARWLDFGGQALELNLACITQAVPQIYTDTTQIGTSPMHAFMGKLDLELIGEVQHRHNLGILVAFGSLANVGRRVAYGCGALGGLMRSTHSEMLLHPNSILETALKF